MTPQILTVAQFQEAMRDPAFRKAYRDSRWYQGDLRGQLRPNGQRWVWDFIEERHERDPTPEPFVVETHRRYGKSHFFLMWACKRCNSVPGQRVLFLAPTKEQALPIVKPNMERVLSSCPGPLRPRASRFSYIFRNPRWPRDALDSVLEIYGVNPNPDAIRGGGCDMCVIDEAGYVNELERVINEIVVWQFSKRHKPFLCLMSTPPRSMDHPFITKYIPEAKAADRYFGIKASQNPDFTKEDERIVLLVCGTKDSVAWKREAEIEHITDPESMIVPEWLANRESLIREWTRPSYFYPMVSIDIGWKDKTHALLFYVDFEAQKLIVEDEIWVNYTTQGQIVELLREKEAKLWGGDDIAHFSKLRRIADSPMISIESFPVDYGFSVDPAMKHDSEAALASLRRRVQEHKIIVHPRCEQLIYQLDNGVWNDKRSDFVKSDALGHCDGIKALQYANRQARWKDNPFPDKILPRDKFHRKERLTFKRKEKKEHPLIEALRK